MLKIGRQSYFQIRSHPRRCSVMVRRKGHSCNRQSLRPGRNKGKALSHRSGKQCPDFPRRRIGSHSRARAPCDGQHVPRCRQGDGRHGNAKRPGRGRRVSRFDAHTGMLPCGRLRDRPPWRGRRACRRGNSGRAGGNDSPGYVGTGIPADPVRKIGNPEIRINLYFSMRIPGNNAD